MTTLTSQKSKRVTIVCIAAMTAILGVAAASLSSQPGLTQIGAAFANDVTQQSGLRSDAVTGIGAVAASRKVQCIMPAAWRRNCQG